MADTAESTASGATIAGDDISKMTNTEYGDYLVA